MVFVYPCITSENVNRQIVPAATKSMELFFLYQLQSAFNDGVITCKQEFDRSRGVPGVIKFECTDKSTKGELMLEHSFDVLESVKMIVTENSVAYVNNYERPRVSQDDTFKDIITESQNIEEKLHGYRIQLNGILDDDKSSKVLKESAVKVLDSVINDIKTEHSFRRTIEEGAVVGGSGNKGSNKTINQIKKLIKGSKSEKEDKGKRENFKKAEDYKIDLTPTSMPIEVDVYAEDSRGNEKWTRKVITIGVKVAPIKIKNFKQVNDALLDDYFQKVSDSVFKAVARGISKGVMGAFRKVLDKVGISKLLPDPVDSAYEKKGDIVKKLITMAPSNYVNASAFRSNLREAPINYKFTSSVVMFNKDDIDEDESIFRNRAAMIRLFKLGWTSFAILDPIKEVMLFISNLDGGFLHELPYSYMFNTLNAKDIYKDQSALRNGSRPFSISRGNFATFSRMF